MKNTLWWLIGGTQGGLSRAEMLKALKERPSTAAQLVKRLDLDYHSVRFHLDILQKNGAVARLGKKYNEMYSLSPEMESNWNLLEEILVRMSSETRKGARNPRASPSR